MFGFNNKTESGVIVVGGQHIASTRQCVHCGRHEVIRAGSGKKRGWCVKCTGFLCGRKPCLQNCVPYEARIEYEEAQNARKQEAINKLLTRYPALKDAML